jgi:peptide methionine sulfoxide reductase MsrB
VKIKRKRLREIVTSVVQEAAKEGVIQKVYKKSYDNMIKKMSTAGNTLFTQNAPSSAGKNTPPFTKKAAKAGKSGPPG